MQITLRNTSSLAVIDTQGAEMRSFQDGFGTEYLWQADSVYWNRTSPLLFPCVGRLRDGKTTIDGVEYSIPKHGFLRDREFRLAFYNDEKAILSYLSNDKDYEIFPFRFNFQVTYTLEGCSLKVQYDVFNMDDKEMPFCIGAHPGFRVPVFGDEPFENYYIELDRPVTASIPYFTGSEWDNSKRREFLKDQKRFFLNHSMFDGDAIFLDEVKPVSVTLASVLSGRGVQMNIEGFESIAFWTPAGKQAPFVCLEPWAGSDSYTDEDGDFRKKRQVQTVQPDEKKTYSFTIEML
ncbi:MAG: aldose 1-epimerase family protein [Massiliimalia sp.]|jgi:galactose mutarotase-like enzyme